MLKEKIRDFYSLGYLNCAESMLYGANDYYDLKLDKKAFKLMSPFGGGMQVESVCGAITGALSVIGVIFTEKYQHEGELIKTVTKDFMSKMKKVFGSYDCSEIKKDWRDEEKGCVEVVSKVGEILEETINKYRE